MVRTKRTPEEMTHDFTLLSQKVLELQHVLQKNEEYISSTVNPPSDAEVQEWSDSVNKVMSDLNALKNDVMFYFWS